MSWLECAWIAGLLLLPVRVALGDSTRYPILLRDGSVIYSDVHPTSAFGSVHHVVDGNAVSIPASAVDLRRSEVAWATARAEEQLHSHPLQGARFPDVSTHDFHGVRHALPTGRLSYIELWSPSCLPCRRRLAAAASIAKATPSLQFIAIAVLHRPVDRRTATKVLAGLERPIGRNWTDLVVDPDAQPELLADLMQGRASENFIVDESNVIRHSRIGEEILARVVRETTETSGPDAAAREAD